MALEWADFPSGETGLYGTTTALMLNGTPWVFTGTISSGGLTTDPDPLVAPGSVCYRVSSGVDNNPFITPGLSLALRTTTTGKVWCAARVWYSEFDGSVVENIFAICSLSDGQTSYIMRKELNGALSIIRRAGTGPSFETVLATTTAPAITTNAWIHLSFEVNPTTGECSIQKEGDPLLSVTDAMPLGFTAAFIKSMDRTSNTLGTPFLIKDFCNGNALGTVNLGHPGSVSVTDLRPSADDTLGGWTTSSGVTGFDLINETPPDDADYIAAADSPLPLPAQFELTNLPADVSSVRGLISIVRARKIDGGDGNLQIALTPNGVAYASGVDRPITSAATYWADVSELSPATGVAWATTEVDTLEIRVDRTV